MRLSADYSSIEGRSLRLVPFKTEHGGAYWTLLQREPENTALFRQIYHVQPSNEQDVSATIVASLSCLGDDNTDGTVTWTVGDIATNTVLGWAILTTTSAAPRLAECALFLPRLQRSERGSECIFYLHLIVFDEMELERLEFRTGALEDSEGLGITIIGVLQRQLLDKSRSQDSNLYVITRDQWPVIKKAVMAWLEMKKGPALPGA